MQQVPLQATLALVSTEKVLVHIRTKVKFEGSPPPLLVPSPSHGRVGLQKSGRVLCVKMPALYSVQNESLTKSFDTQEEPGGVGVHTKTSQCSLGDYCTVGVII